MTNYDKMVVKRSDKPKKKYKLGIVPHYVDYDNILKLLKFK